MTSNDHYTGWSRVESEETRTMIRRASRQMGDLVRSTLGPFGLDKMVVRRMPDNELRGFVSNDGVAIIEEFEGETDHPIAQHFITLAEDHEDDYGDGVTTMFLLASDLLVTAMDLVEQGIHPNDIVEGFSIGAQRTLEHWKERAIPLTGADGKLDHDRLETIAMSGMVNGRTGSWPLDEIADVVVGAVLRVSDPATRTTRLDHADNIVVPGGAITDSEVVEGTILPESVVVAERLLPLEGAVLLIDGALESRSLSHDVNIVADTNPAIGTFGESKEIVDVIASTDTVAVVASNDVDMAIAKELAAHGIVLLRNVKASHFEYIARATGAKPYGPISPNTAIDPALLGSATIKFRDTGRDDDWIEFASPPGTNRPAVTLLVRGGTETAAEETERRISDGKNALRAAIKNPLALPAGGAADVSAAVDVRSLATRFDGREQLAVDAFADTLETIPKTLASNAGLDPLDTMSTLHNSHDAGHTRAAVSKNGTVVDDVTADGGGLDAFQIRVSGLIRAVEFVNAFVRIDSMLVDERDPTIDRVLDEPKYQPGEVPDVE